MALRERDAWVAECEQRAGQALVHLVDSDGLTTTEAVPWCAGEISVSEAARLRRLVRAAGAAALAKPYGAPSLKRSNRRCETGPASSGSRRRCRQSTGLPSVPRASA